MKKVLAVFCTAVIVLMGLFIQPANATSIYDSLYTPMTAIEVGNPNRYYDCDLTDISYSWASYVTDSSHWDSASDSTMIAQKDSFLQALDTGSWGVSVQGYGDPNYKSVLVFWNESSDIPLEWFYSPSLNLHYLLATVDHAAQISCRGNKIIGATVALDSPSSQIVIHNDFPGDIRNVFVHTDLPNYPNGYQGQPIPTSYTPPTPPTTVYNGSVDCGNDSLGYMLLTQDGSTNPVTLNYESAYRASWSYSLTSSPYTITVGCGDSLATSYGSVSPVTSSNDWICDTTVDPHYCILS